MVNYIDVGGDNLQSALDRFTDPFGTREALRRLGGTLGSTLDDSAREFAKNGRVERSQEDTDTLLENIRYGDRIMKKFSSCCEGVRSGYIEQMYEETIRRTSGYMRHVFEEVLKEIRKTEKQRRLERLERERIAAMIRSNVKV